MQQKGIILHSGGGGSIFIVLVFFSSSTDPLKITIIEGKESGESLLKVVIKINS